VDGKICEGMLTAGKSSCWSAFRYAEISFRWMRHVSGVVGCALRRLWETLKHIFVGYGGVDQPEVGGFLVPYTYSLVFLKR